jgi:hypothetical protein
MTGTGAVTARRLLAGAASLAISVPFFWAAVQAPAISRKHAVFAGIIGGLPLAAALALWSTRVLAQALSRGVWWSYLVVGAFIASSSRADESHAGAYGAVCAAVALLAAGRTALDRGTDGTFQPVAFRGTLLLSLVLALADAAALTSLGVIVPQGRGLLLTLGVVMAAGVVGLVRLRTWGLIVALACNAVVAALALSGTLPVSHLLQKVFTFTALLQLVVPLPMLVALVRRRPPGPDRLQGARWAAATLAIVVFAGFSVYASLIDRAPFTR